MGNTLGDGETTIYKVTQSTTRVYGSVTVKGLFTNKSAALEHAKNLCAEHRRTEGNPERFGERGRDCVGGYRNEAKEWSVIEHLVFDSADAYNNSADTDS